MSVFNQCSQLVNAEELATVQDTIANFTRNGRDSFQIVLDTQVKLQQALAQKLPDNGNVDPTNMAEKATCGELVEYLRYQKDLIDDEFRELLTSLGGMSNGTAKASAVWKRWKAQHREVADTKFSNLSPEDKLEVQFEVIDIMHYIANMINAVGLDAKSMIELYLLKNAENINRYNSGY